MNQHQDPPIPDWATIVAAVQCGQQAGSVDLRRMFVSGLVYYFESRGFIGHTQDVVDVTLVEVCRLIRAHKLGRPEELPHCVHTTAVCVAGQFVRLTRGNQGDVPVPESLRVTEKVMASLPKLDRELLARYYSDGQSRELICSELGIEQQYFESVRKNALSRISREASSAGLGSGGWLARLWAKAARGGQG